jgi:hypothetical protein
MNERRREIHPMKLSADGQEYEVEVNFPVGKHAFKFLLVSSTSSMQRVRRRKGQ